MKFDSNGNTFSKKLTDKKKEVFYRELGMLLKSGVDFKKALEILSQQSGSKFEKQLILTIKDKVVHGKSIYEALMTSGQFSPYEYYSIQIGEETRKLEEVLAELQKALDRDRARTSVTDFSALGLVEMTRKRTRESLAHLLCEPCPSCQGKGQVKTAQTVAYEIMREIVRESRQFNPKEFRILASPAVIDLFLEEEAQHLGMLEEFVGKPITLQVDNLFVQEHYDIILT